MEISARSLLSNFLERRAEFFVFSVFFAVISSFLSLTFDPRFEAAGISRRLARYRTAYGMEAPDSPSPSKRVIPARRYRRKRDALPKGVSGAPNERKLVELMEKTGCMISQTNGQRRFGPPPDWPPDEPPPPRGCEVFIGKIPRDLYEDELVPVLQMIGRLYELRLMMEFSGNNRGYAFAVFASRDEAKQCVRALDNYEIRRGRSLGASLSVDNCRLFIGGIPKKSVAKADILDEMRRLTDGVVDAIVYASVDDKTKNRGFAFVEYENHRAAAIARRKLMRQRLVVWGTKITVNWADPEHVIDDDVMATVKRKKFVALFRVSILLFFVFRSKCSTFGIS